MLVLLTWWGNRLIAPNRGTAGLLGRKWICHLFPIGFRRFSWHRGINLFVNNTDYIKSKLIIDNYQRKDRLIYDRLLEKRLYHDSTRKQRFWPSDLETTKKKNANIQHRKITKARVQVHNLFCKLKSLMHAMIYICWLADRLIAASIIWKTNHNLAFTQTSKSVRRKRTLTSVPLLMELFKKNWTQHWHYKQGVFIKTSQLQIRILTEKFWLSRGSSLQYLTSAFKTFKFLANF